MITKNNQKQPKTTKNNLLLAVFAFCSIAYLFTSCIEDETDNYEIPISSEVLAAKTWFESNEASFWDQGSENARISAKEIRKKINWDRSKPMFKLMVRR